MPVGKHRYDPKFVGHRGESTYREGICGFTTSTDVFHLRTGSNSFPECVRYSGQLPPSLVRPSPYSEMAFHIDGASTAVTAATKPWKSPPLLLLLATPSSPQRKQLRRRKYYGQFEAGSRADVLPEYAESDDEDRDGVEEEERCCGGWSVQEMKRRTSILRSSLLGEYHTTPELVQVPTGPGLRDLPIIFQVRPLYSFPIGAETVSMSETMAL
ncbi:hypothetical protein K438DRAFT_1975538 [Mycena galopus ATCC 62051]|nr:hypothetical protein K438DRAFT_1975538 [Mycena galopus ATCC 62051]